MVLFFTHIPFVVNYTINVTPPERLQHYLNIKTNGTTINQLLGFDKNNNYLASAELILNA